MNTQETEITQRTVYVVFHGLISIVERKGGEFCAYILSTGPEHRYLYGNWLREADIPAGFSGKFCVGEGPCQRQAHLDPKERPLVSFKQCTMDEHHEAIHGSIRLPQPDKILYANSGKLELRDSGKCQLLNPNVQKNSGTTIFVYQVENFDDCYLMDDRRFIKWEATAKPGEDKHKVAALHVFSNPQYRPSASHSVDEFHLSSVVLGATALRLAKQVQDESHSTWKPQGLCTEELLSLSRRDDILAWATDLLRTPQSERPVLRPSSGGGCESCCSGADGGDC